LGRIWARVLRSHRLGPLSTVVEIGPGFATKIGCGLAEIGFRGTVILVEPNDSARNFAIQQYEKLLPKATVLACDLPVPDASFLAGRSVDLVAANHALDDLLLNAHVLTTEGASLFSEMRPGEDCSTVFLQAWNGLLATAPCFRRLARRVARDMYQYINVSQARFAMLYQYPSGHHVRPGLTSIHPYTVHVMRLIRDQLSTESASGRRVQLIRNRSARWLIVRSNYRSTRPTHRRPGQR
jgi:hypothetical protein